MSTIRSVLFDNGTKITDEFVCKDVCVGNVCLYTNYNVCHYLIGQMTFNNSPLREWLSCLHLVDQLEARHSPETQIFYG